MSENEDEFDARRAADYAYHKAAGSLGDYYAMYPMDCPWDWGMTPEERNAALGRTTPSRERERER